MSDRIAISDPVKQICEAFGIDPKYVARIDITPSDVDVTLFRGKDGRCKGPKFVLPEGGAAKEIVSFKVWT